MFKNLAPHITRQRLLIEGFYTLQTVTPQVIEDYFHIITQKLELRMYGKPIIFSPGGDGKEDNQGYDAFVPLIDSGISVYIWSKHKFFSGIIYTCKSFDVSKAEETTKEFFKIPELVPFSF
jgi:hypothetical protein